METVTSRLVPLKGSIAKGKPSIGISRLGKQGDGDIVRASSLGGKTAKGKPSIVISTLG